MTLSGVSTLTRTATSWSPRPGRGGWRAGGSILVSRQDVVLSHNAPAAGGLTVDVTDLNVRAGDDVTVNAGAVGSGEQRHRHPRAPTSPRSPAASRPPRSRSARPISISRRAGRSATRRPSWSRSRWPAAPTPPGVPAQPTILGGATQGPGYTLTGAEAGRIRAGTLRILVPALSANPARAPDLIVRDLTLNGGGAAAGIGTLEIVTPGIARVEGNLLMAGARAHGRHRRSAPPSGSKW